MATVKFESRDRRDLIDILIKANVSGDAPDVVEIDGNLHELRYLWKLLPFDEPLQPHVVLSGSRREARIEKRPRSHSA